MAYDPISRRHFLRGLGYAMWIPLLPSLLPREARAQLAQPPTRFLAITGVNGMYPQDFWSTFDAPNTFNGIADVRYKALSELNGAPISNVLGTQFNSVINKINIIRGLDGTTDTPGGHSFAPYTPPALTGSFSGGFGYSVDSVMADSSLIYPSAPSLRALRVSSVLDNSFVVWTNEMSEGKLHSLISMPVLTAGGAGGKIRTGNLIDYRQRDNTGKPVTINADGYGYMLDLGRPYNELVTAFNAVGMSSPASYEKKGIQGFGDYLRADTYGKYFNAGKRNPLPYLFKV